MNRLQRRLANLRAVWKPDLYHGWTKQNRYFEGWYFKLIDPTGDHALAVIPGISMDAQGERFAFIQVNDGKHGVGRLHRFPAEEFRPHPKRFSLAIGDNRFTTDGLDLDLPELNGRLRFRGSTPWPVSLLSPGAMGWYGLVPGMECYHGVVSMDHELEGELDIEGEAVDFSGGRGYAEKDWGQSFPRGWVWGQSNHFADSPPSKNGGAGGGTSLMFSLAHVPWRGSYFVGFVAGLWHRGRLHRFATYTRARAELRLLDEPSHRGLELVLHSPPAELRIVAHQAEGVELESPIDGAMVGKVNESLEARLAVEMLVEGVQVFCGVGRHAGLEIAGNTEVLFRDLAPGSPQ